MLTGKNCAQDKSLFANSRMAHIPIEWLDHDEREQSIKGSKLLIFNKLLCYIEMT
jgi:hypothetical protein